METTDSMTTPSFAARTEAWLYGRKCRCYRINSKLGSYHVLDRLGISHPDVHGVLRGLDRLTPEHLALPVVLKPLDASSAIGVMNLEPDGDGRWFESIRQEKHTFESIIDQLSRRVLKRGYPDEWLLEEPMRPPPYLDRSVIDDVKVYAFAGETPLLQVRRSTDRKPVFRWFTLPDGTPDPDVGKFEKRIDESIDLPHDTDQIIDVARRISSAVPLPFLRVDTIPSSRGVVVGELNTHVGGWWTFSAEWDRELGEKWADAEQRLPRRHSCVRVPKRLAKRRPLTPWTR